MEDDQGTEDLFGEDWRSKVQAKGGRQYEDPFAVSLERSRERGRGREATAPETIPPLGWRDILWRVLEGNSGPHPVHVRRRCLFYATRLLPGCRDHCLPIWSRD